MDFEGDFATTERENTAEVVGRMDEGPHTINVSSTEMETNPQAALGGGGVDGTRFHGETGEWDSEIPSKRGSLLATNTNNESSPTTTTIHALWYSSPATVDPETGASPSFNSSTNGPFCNDSSAKSLYEAARLFSIQVYQTILLLRFPTMYFRRVVGSNGHQATAGDSGMTANGKYIWEEFIDSLVREWKMSTSISGVLTLVTLAILRIPEAANDPFTKTAALLSLICALMSISYGGIYIMKFGTLRSIYRSLRWAEEVNTATWWNVWVLLAMPVVSTSWSMLLLLASIISYIWFNGSGTEPSSPAQPSATVALGPRLALTGLLVVGMIYLVMIMKTLMRYSKEQGEMRVDAEMSLGAVPVQSGELEDRGRET